MRILPLVMTATVLLATPLSAQTLYGASTGMSGGFGPSDLFTIDTASGTPALVGPIGFDNVTGLTCLPDGRMVGSFRADDLVAGPAAGLIEIDQFTGAGTLIGIISETATGGCGRMPDITYDAATGSLFAYGDFCVGDPEGPFTVDPVTGAGTSVGASGYSGGGNGLAAEPGSGILFGTPSDDASLVTFDPFTGAGTEVPGSAGNVPIRVNALDFHPLTGVLYGSYAAPGSNNLVTIDTSNGVTTTLGATVDGLDAISFECTPIFLPLTPVDIPTTNGVGLSLLALVLLVSGWMVMRRARF